MTPGHPAKDKLHFPAGFVWGSGISAHQCEGGNDRNDWWAFEEAGCVVGKECSGRACDHFGRYPDDFRLAASLGHKAVKISVEWSRIEPRRGEIDAEAVAHYVDVVKEMRASGLAPIVALHHFTSPVWMEDVGWWESRESVEAFGRYVRVVAEALSPWVEMWITINEPMALVSAGYLFGIWPPQKRSVRSAMRVARSLIAAHRLAHAVLHDVDPDCRVGPAVNVTALKHPEGSPLRYRVLGGVSNWIANYYFVDRVRDRSEFIGVQYYSRATVQQLLAGDPLAIPRGVRRLPRTDMGWEIYPKGLYKTVLSMSRRLDLPIWVTENGLADAADTKRSQFIRDHLIWLHRAIAEGARVEGYLYWSLIDNFEWKEGFAPRFGLVEVDYDTLERTPRGSAYFFEKICRENAVPLTATGMLR